MWQEKLLYQKTFYTLHGNTGFIKKKKKKKKKKQAHRIHKESKAAKATVEQVGHKQVLIPLLP